MAANEDNFNETTMARYQWFCKISWRQNDLRCDDVWKLKYTNVAWTINFQEIIEGKRAF